MLPYVGVHGDQLGRVVSLARVACQSLFMAVLRRVDISSGVCCSVYSCVHGGVGSCVVGDRAVFRETVGLRVVCLGSTTRVKG